MGLPWTLCNLIFDISFVMFWYKISGQIIEKYNILKCLKKSPDVTENNLKKEIIKNGEILPHL
jgi:hypothetical protein